MSLPSTLRFSDEELVVGRPFDLGAEAFFRSELHSFQLRLQLPIGEAGNQKRPVSFLTGLQEEEEFIQPGNEKFFLI